MGKISPGDHEADVASLKIVGKTKDVNCGDLSDVTVTLHPDDVGLGSTVSDRGGKYGLAVPPLGDYNATASKTGFRSRARTILVTQRTAPYTLDFVGRYGLVSNAPGMSYVQACINR